MITCYLALGSNLGDSAGHLRFALEELAALPGTRIRAVSSAWRSAAVGPGEQPDYLNAVLELATALPPHELLQATQDIEARRGRTREEHWGPRTLDIDILLYGNEIIDTPTLQVPHPRLTQRNFVLYPLAEIAGEQLRLPSAGVLGSLLAQCPRQNLEPTGVSLTDRTNPAKESGPRCTTTAPSP